MINLWEANHSLSKVMCFLVWFSGPEISWGHRPFSTRFCCATLFSRNFHFVVIIWLVTFLRNLDNLGILGQSKLSNINDNVFTTRWVVWSHRCTKLQSSKARQKICSLIFEVVSHMSSLHWSCATLANTIEFSWFAATPPPRCERLACVKKK